MGLVEPMRVLCPVERESEENGVPQPMESDSEDERLKKGGEEGRESSGRESGRCDDE